MVLNCTSGAILDVDHLGSDICNNILFLHAFTGSDTTSRIFGIGKATAQEKLMKDKQLQAAANVFSSDGRQQIDIEFAGHKAILLLYGCKIGDSLQNTSSSNVSGKSCNS